MRAAKSRHQPRTEKRRSSVERGYTHRWNVYAEQFKRDWPFCVACETLERAEVVDHILPVRGPNDPLFWEQWNHQPLCRRCHTAKTNDHDARLMIERREILKATDRTRRGTILAANLKIGRPEMA